MIFKSMFVTCHQSTNYYKTFVSIFKCLHQIPIRFVTSTTTTHFGFDEVPENEKQTRVNEVFSSVAKRYDVMNDLMSLGIHRVWKDYFIGIIKPNASWNYIDVAGGTGDIAFRYLNYIDRNFRQTPTPTPTLTPTPPPTDLSSTPEINISSTPTHSYMADSRTESLICPTSNCVVVDINSNMLNIGRQRAQENNLASRIQWIEGNAESLPFQNEQFDLYTIAFGIRNCTHYDNVVKEAYRVLKKGGRFLCLEFSQINNPLLRYAYDQYSVTFIPPLGQIIAGDWKSYQYLIESIRQFPSQEEFSSVIRSCGFRFVSYKNLSFGIAAIHSGYKL